MDLHSGRGRERAQTREVSDDRLRVLSLTWNVMATEPPETTLELVLDEVVALLKISLTEIYILNRYIYILLYN